MSHGLYRVHWTRSGRVIEFATRAQDVLGTEYPNHVDPIPYRPELLVTYWRERDRLEREVADAETRLHEVTRAG